MEKVIYIREKITPFKSEWGVICEPIPYDNGYVIPLGWESELKARNIKFEIINYKAPEIEL